MIDVQDVQEVQDVLGVGPALAARWAALSPDAAQSPPNAGFR